MAVVPIPMTQVVNVSDLYVNVKIKRIVYLKFRLVIKDVIFYFNNPVKQFLAEIL